MNRRTYRAEVDAVSFRPDFQERTVARLTALAREKENAPMKKFNMRTGLIAAALVAALAVTASAAVALLSPKQVAEAVGDPALARAFQSDGAVAMDAAARVGDYDVTLAGLVSGQGLSSLTQEVDTGRTYAVLSIAAADGSPLTDAAVGLTASPLVEGYLPWQVNAWTLGGGYSSFALDGRVYYLFACDSLEVFADHTVYLAVYAGEHQIPSAEIFAVDGEGAISYQDGQDGTLFTLPLDQSKADPAQAEALTGTAPIYRGN